MNWEDKGFLLSKNKYSENSLIIDVFSKEHGKVSGIVFGGTSKKIKNYLQIGNSLYINYNSKNDNRIGYLKIEILKPLAPLYFDNQKKLLCISSAMNLIKILSADLQKNENIYDLIENFYYLLNNDNWIKNYIFWELELFKYLGYDLNFRDLVEKKTIENQFQYVSKSLNQKKIIPKFLVEKDHSSEDLNTLLSGLKLVGDYLEKTILKPKNLNYPLSRILFINTIR